MKNPAELLILFYQKCLSPLKIQPSCRYYPSCSSYALDAVRRYGVVKGVILASWRILRCNPWSRGGVDYVPSEFYLRLWKNKKWWNNPNKPPKL